MEWSKQAADQRKMAPRELCAEVVFCGANSLACEVSSQLVNARKRDLRVISRESFFCNSFDIC